MCDLLLHTCLGAYPRTALLNPADIDNGFDSPAGQGTVSATR